MKPIHPQLRKTLLTGAIALLALSATEGNATVLGIPGPYPAIVAAGAIAAYGSVKALDCSNSGKRAERRDAQDGSAGSTGEKQEVLESAICANLAAAKDRLDQLDWRAVIQSTIR